MEKMIVRSSYVGIIDGADFLIDGINVWDHEWSRVPGDSAVVRDPDGREVRLSVNRIEADGAVVTFAADEISNCVWAFYLPAEHEFEAP